MKSSEDIKRQVEETLDMLGRIEKVEPKPYFYTRLMARLERTSEKSRQYQTVRRVQYAFLGLFLLVAVNGLSLYKILPSRLDDTGATNIETFIENYQLEVHNIYTLTENDFN